MSDKESMTKPIIYIAGIPMNNNDVEIMENLAKSLDDNPFIKMYYAPGIYMNFQGLIGSDSWRTNYMNHRKNEILMSDIIVTHEKLYNYDTLFDLGIAEALNKKIVILAKNESKKIFEVNFTILKGEYNLIKDYNFLKLNQK